MVADTKNDIKKTLGSHLWAGLEEMKKVFGRHKKTKQPKPNQISNEQEQREAHIIKKKKEAWEKDKQHI